MSQVVIGDILPYTQATAILNQTVFGTNWTADTESDVVVYVTPPGDDPNDVTQVLPYPAGYSVAFIGAQEEVQVTLVTPSVAGAIVTITRQTPADRLNLYSNTNFLPSMLNNDFGILTLVDQQAQLVDQKIGPRYNYSATIVDVVDTILPILEANQTWVKNSNNTGFIPFDLPSSGIAPADITYVTLDDNLSELPNSFPLNSLAAGSLFFENPSSPTLVTRILTGTANGINVSNGDGALGNPTFSIADNAIIGGTDGAGIPIGTTAQRVIPTLPNINFRLNTNLTQLEFYYGGDWVQLTDSGDVEEILAMLASHAPGEGASLIGLESPSTATVQDMANITYVTLDNNLSVLPNSFPLNSLAAGALFFEDPSMPTLVSRVLTGTANQISIANGDGASGAPTFSISNNPILLGTTGMGIPSGTTGERVVPSSPNINFRVNTTLSQLEYYLSAQWTQLISSLGGNVNFINLPTTTSLSVGVIQQDGAPLLHTYNNNLFLGQGAGNFTAGPVGSRNIGVGRQNFVDLTVGTDNTGVSYFAFSTLTTGAQNGTFGATPFITTGSYGTYLGYIAGSNYTSSESSNIMIQNAGVVGENNICRIGTEGSGAHQITDMYLAGIVHHSSAIQWDVTSITSLTMSQTGTSATFSSNPTSVASAAYVVPASGSPFRLMGYAGTATFPTDISQTIAPGTACTIYYYNLTNNRGAMIQQQPAAQVLFPSFQRIAIGSGSGSFLSVWNHSGSEAFGNGVAVGSGSTAMTGTGVASQSGTTVTASTSVFTASHVGRLIRFGQGYTAFIRSVSSGTVALVDVSQTVPLQAFFIVGTSTNEGVSIGANGDLGSSRLYNANLVTLMGGEIHKVTQVTAATYTALTTDYILSCNRAGTIAVTLIASPETGRTYRIKDISGAAATNNITITPAAGNIDGAANYVINTNYGSIDVTYSGAQWSIL